MEVIFSGQSISNTDRLFVRLKEGQGRIICVGMKDIHIVAEKEVTFVRVGHPCHDDSR